MSTPQQDLKEVIKQKYGQAALRVKTVGSSCCERTPSTGCSDPITSNLYDASQIGQLPQEALLASFGCGNPTALAQLEPGEMNIARSFELPDSSRSRSSQRASTGRNMLRNSPQARRFPGNSIPPRSMESSLAASFAL